MPRAVPESSAEHAAGMEVFYTDTAPLGGRLRTFAEDFVVDEIGDGPRVDPEGKHLAVRVRLTNWEHNHFIRDVSRKLEISRQSIGFAGTKDKRAVTTQWFSFLTRLPDEEAVAQIRRLPRVEVLEHHRTTKGLRLGMHDGNRFQIIVRDIHGDPDSVRTRLGDTVAALNAIHGFPNFFGIQRFGALRPITHTVGRWLVAGDLREAILTYVTAPAMTEEGDTNEIRARIRETGDWKLAARELPDALKFERAIVQHLSRDPDDLRGALRALPHNLRLLFVHAYQSYLFNRILSERIRRGLPLHEPMEGDLILPASAGIPLDRVDPIRVTPANIDKVRRQAAKGRAAVTAPLMGYATPAASGEPGEVERDVLETSAVGPEAFAMPHMPDLASEGLRRAILTPMSDLESDVRGTTGEMVAEVRFRLPRGAYATTLLREVLKADDVTLY